jgi:hypothetical protein
MHLLLLVLALFEYVASPNSQRLTSIPADQLYNLPAEPEAILRAVFLPRSVSA